MVIKLFLRARLNRILNIIACFHLSIKVLDFLDFLVKYLVLKST